MEHAIKNSALVYDILCKNSLPLKAELSHILLLSLGSYIVWREYAIKKATKRVFVCSATKDKLVFILK